MGKKKKLEETWLLMRWTLKFIEENGETWKTEEDDLLEEEKNVLYRWNRMQVKEKLENLLTEADTTPNPPNFLKIQEVCQTTPKSPIPAENTTPKNHQEDFQNVCQTLIKSPISTENTTPEDNITPSLPPIVEKLNHRVYLQYLHTITSLMSFHSLEAESCSATKIPCSNCHITH